MLSIALFLAMVGLNPALPQQTNATPAIIDEIGRLEGDKDPKCYATAGRVSELYSDWNVCHAEAIS